MKKKNVGIIDTFVKQTVWRCCDAALHDGMPAFIYGSTQIGKTTALTAYQREHNHGQTVYIEMGSGWTRARFVRELARKFGNGVKATKAWALEDAIFDTLRRRLLRRLLDGRSARAFLGFDPTLVYHPMATGGVQLTYDAHVYDTLTSVHIHIRSTAA